VPKFQKKRARNIALEHPVHENVASGLAFAILKIGVYVMKAVSYQGPRKMSVSNHSQSKIKSPTDALLRVTTTGICGSDLHMYDGRTPLDKGTVVGHEIMGD
jgi:hypothetical protein